MCTMSSAAYFSYRLHFTKLTNLSKFMKFDLYSVLDYLLPLHFQKIHFRKLTKFTKLSESYYFTSYCDRANASFEGYF